MKKTKFMALTLAVAVMVVGAGYAYWTDSVNINAAVDTGVMSVGFHEITIDEEDPLESEEFDTMKVNAIAANTEDNELGVTHHKGIEVNISNFYPGAEALLNMKLKNDGSIPTQVKDVKVDLTEVDDELLNKSNGIYFAGVMQHVRDGEVIKTHALHSRNLEQLQGDLSATKNWTLQPGDYITFKDDRARNEEAVFKGLRFMLDEDEVKYENNTQNKTANIKIDFTFKQPNEK